MGNEDVAGKLKPSRSDGGEILTEEEQEKYAQQVREFLKSTTPVRSLKPSRSDLEDGAQLDDFLVSPEDAHKAELKRLQELEAHGESLLKRLLYIVYLQKIYFNPLFWITDQDWSLNLITIHFWRWGCFISYVELSFGSFHGWIDAGIIP